MNYKKIVSCALAFSMLASFPAYAAETGTSSVELEADATQMTVSVPTVLPASIDAEGQSTVASNAKIVNSSYGPVLITGVAVQSVSPWGLVDDSHNFSKDKVGSKNARITVQNTIADKDGNVSIDRTDWPSISGNGGELPFTYDTEVSAQKEAIQNENIARVVFTVDWDVASSGGGSSSTEESTKATSSNSPIANGALQIPAQIEGKPVTSIASGAFQGNQDVQSVVLPETIKTVENNAFSGASNLTDVELNEGLEEIGDSAFEGTGITQITIPSTTHTVGNNALNTPTLENVVVNQTEEEFANNNIASNAIPETVIPNYSTSNIPDENPPLDPEPAIEDVSQNWEYRIVGGKTIYLEKYKGESNNVVVKNSYQADGTTYNSVRLSASYPKAGPFLNNTNISSISFEDDFIIQDGYMMFEGCSNLASIDLSNVDFSDCTNLSYMFKNCRSLTSLDLSALSSGNAMIREMQGTLMNCSNLENVNFGTFTAENVSDMSYLFYGCNKLTDIDLSNFTGTKLTTITDLCYKCASLNSIDLSNLETASITSRAYTFTECSSLTSITVKDENAKTMLIESVPASCTITVKAA